MARKNTTGWVTAKGAAQHLGLSISTFRKAVMPFVVAYRLSRVLRYRVEDLDAWARTRRVTAA